MLYEYYIGKTRTRALDKSERGAFVFCFELEEWGTKVLSDW